MAETVEEKDIPWVGCIEVGGSRDGVVEVVEENDIPKVVHVAVEGNSDGVVKKNTL